MNNLSVQQQKYLDQRRKQRLLIHLFRYSLLLFFCILWETAACLGWIDSFIFSSPSRVATTFYRMCLDGSIFLHTGVTLAETLISFLLVTVLSISTAILLWFQPQISAILEPYFVILNSLPKSALAPLLIVWLGTNRKTVIVAGLSVAIFGSIITLYTGFQETDPEKIKLIRTLGGKRRHILTKVLLPANVPLLLSVMKVNIGLCLVGVIIGEFLASKSGLGYLIIYGSQVFKLDWVVMSILILCFIAMGLYLVLQKIERWYLKKI